MLTGALRNQIDAAWNAFWAGGIANQLEVIEQITYLLFISGLDGVQNPPFPGSLDNEAVEKDLLKTVETKKTELLFMALSLRLLKPGRARR
ncbi:MAG: hypothetical protein KF849_06510 [Rhizobiaceae bacterium]|nr:hypothetical protein [Rhizobiaceae bacterium]